MAMVSLGEKFDRRERLWFPRKKRIGDVSESLQDESEVFSAADLIPRSFPERLLSKSGRIRFDFSAKGGRQIIQGFGGSIAFYSNYITEHPDPAVREAIYDVLFKDLRPSVVRMRNSYEQPQPPHLTAARVMGFAKKLIDAANARLPGAWKPKIMLTSWSPPDYMKANGKLTGMEDNNTLKKDPNGKFIYKEYAEKYWLASLNKYAELGIVPRWISIQNEPNWKTLFHASCLFDTSESYNRPSYYRAFDEVYDTLHRQMASPPGMIGPETTGVDLFRGHRYAGSPRMEATAQHLYTCGWTFREDNFQKKLQEKLKIARKEATRTQQRNLFMTEYANLKTHEHRDPLHLAETIYSCLAIGGMNMYLHWDLFWASMRDEGTLLLVDSPYEGRSTWNNAAGFERTQSFYWFQHFTRFVRPGMKLYAVSEQSGLSDILPLSFSSKEATAIILINKGTHAAIVDLAELPPSLSAHTYRRYFSTLTQRFTEDNSFDIRALELPAESITSLYSGADPH